MKQIIIGKEGNQPFAIPDPQVSRRHAILTIDGQTLQLVDNSSTNGTFIYNGQMFVRLYPNQAYIVTPDTMIQLGPNTRFHVRRLLSKPVPQPPVPNSGASGQTPKPKQEKSVDIRPLYAVQNRYKKEKMNVEAKTGLINSLRSASLLISMGAGGMSGFISNVSGVDSTWNWVFSVLIGVILFAVMILITSSMNKKVIARRDANEHQYAIRYVCPNCHRSYRGVVYENILAEGSCSRCKVKYYDSAIKK